MASSSSTATNCKKSSSPVNLLSLPDDLVLNCLARISRFCYPSLSLVSKRFNSLLASKELYKTRMLMGCTESCIYGCSSSDYQSNPDWFILCPRPTQILNPNPKPNPNPNKSSDNVIVSVPTHNYFPKRWLDLVAVVSNIYLTSVDDFVPSSRVFFLDPSHTWHEAPSMRVARRSHKMIVLDGKIYVYGGIEDYNSLNWMECFDPKTQKWEHVPTLDDIPMPSIFKSLAFEGNLYLFGKKGVVDRPKENRWDVVGLEMNLVRTDMCFSCNWDSFCVIDNILYGYVSWRKLEWYDSELRSWRVLKGEAGELSMLPEPFYSCVKLVNFGGKIAVYWEDVLGNNDYTKKIIWCAVIALENHNKHEIRGKVEWCNVVHTDSKSWNLKKCIAVTV